MKRNRRRVVNRTAREYVVHKGKNRQQRRSEHAERLRDGRNSPKARRKQREKVKQMPFQKRVSLPNLTDASIQPYVNRLLAQIEDQARQIAALKKEIASLKHQARNMIARPADAA